MSTLDFQAWPKIGRLNKAMMTITEKLDGTNAQVNIGPIELQPDGFNTQTISICSRNREIGQIFTCDGKYKGHLIHDKDNYGFMAWCVEECTELLKLGEGRHYGEWWGQGIGRGYDQEGRFFSLFNVRRWQNAYNALKAGHEAQFPNSVLLVPTLYVGEFDGPMIDAVLFALLQGNGSHAVPGYMNPEGIVVEAFNDLFKLTYEHKDGKWQSEAKAAA